MRNLFLRDFLDSKEWMYNTPDFIEDDPISIPHSFDKKEDIEISGILSATIAWGHRKSIIKNGKKMMSLMDNSPYDFVLNHSESDLRSLEDFKHRTFNGDDFKTYITQLKKIYKKHSGLEKVFSSGINLNSQDCSNAIENFRNVFKEGVEEERLRTLKHVASPLNGSAAKRMVMFLRWMVREDNKGVDFGIWKSIEPSILSCPLDVHSGNVARKLGVLNRKQNDWKAVMELDNELRKFDPVDPAKYDFALFGLGVYENFSV